MNSSDRYPLSWIPDFIKSVRPYIHLRKEDNLIILLPNQVYKLNSSAIEILDGVLNSGSLDQCLDRWRSREKIRRDIYYFFCDLKALISGCFGDGAGRKAVEHVSFQTPFSGLPILSELALTYRCNLACLFCYAGCNCTSRSDVREMSTEDAKRVLGIIRHEADVPSVSFTGGEPTLRPDLPELIEFARGLGMRVNLISNGTRITGDLVQRLSDAGLNSAQISIEGPNEEVHDLLTHVSGSFIKSWRGIEALQETDIYVQTNTTINAQNAHCVSDIADLVKERGLDRFAMNMLTPSGSALGNDHLTISYSEIGDVVKRVQARANALGLTFFWYSPTPYCLFNPIANGLGNKSCAACDGLLSISPRGDVLPCSSFDYGVGNILEEDFISIWNSAQAVFWREKRYAPDHCLGCKTINACAAACPLYWEARGTAELECNLASMAK